MRFKPSVVDAESRTMKATSGLPNLSIIKKILSSHIRREANADRCHTERAAPTTPMLPSDNKSQTSPRINSCCSPGMRMTPLVERNASRTEVRPPKNPTKQDAVKVDENASSISLDHAFCKRRSQLSRDGMTNSRFNGKGNSEGPSGKAHQAEALKPKLSCNVTRENQAKSKCGCQPRVGGKTIQNDASDQLLCSCWESTVSAAKLTNLKPPPKA